MSNCPDLTWDEMSEAQAIISPFALTEEDAEKLRNALADPDWCSEIPGRRDAAQRYLDEYDKAIDSIFPEEDGENGPWNLQPHYDSYCRRNPDACWKGADNFGGSGDRLSDAGWREYAYEYYSDSINVSSPLVIDLDGDGIELISLTESDVYFDLDGDGFMQQTGWVTADDGLLVVDPNGDLCIDSWEIFGTETESGFIYLAAYDDNGDGIVDASDSRFSELMVWQDLDADGFSCLGELAYLSDVGITAISLNISDVEYEISGNPVTEESSVVWADGHATDIADIWFSYDSMQTIQITPDLSVAPEVYAEVLTLFTIRGAGQVSDLGNAMLVDDNLLQMVEDFANLTVADVASYAAAVEAIIYRWTGVEGAIDGSRGNTDAKKLEAMEELFGKEWIGDNGYDYVCGDAAAADLQQAWDILFDAIYIRLVVQGPLQSLFPSVTYDWRSDTLETTESVSTLFSEVGAAAQGTRSEVVTYWQALVPICDLLAGELGLDTAAYEQALTGEIFASGLAVTVDMLRDGTALTFRDGTSGADTLTGGTGTDIIDGGAGNDNLQGSSGDDAYVVGPGDGNDTIYDAGGNDTLFLEVTSDAVSVRHLGSNKDLEITLTATGEKIVINDYFYRDQLYVVEAVTFSDGTTWSYDDVKEFYFATMNRASADAIYGSNEADVIDGGGGNDTIEGWAGDDTYRWGTGSGNDIVFDAAGNDTLALTVNPGDVSLKNTGGTNDLEITIIATGEKIVINDYFYRDQLYLVETITFADGTVWDYDDLKTAYFAQMNRAAADTIYGSNEADVIDGGGGADNIQGGAGNDTYVWRAGSGNDTLYDVGGTDTLELDGLYTTDVAVRNLGSSLDLEITNTATGEKVVINDYFYRDSLRLMETITFEDGTTWNYSQVVAAYYSQMNRANADTIYGTTGADTIDGGGGNDTIQSNTGNDTVLFGMGSGQDVVLDTGGTDTVQFGAGIDETELWFSRSGNNLVIDMLGGSEQIVIQSWYSSTNNHVETLRLDDGTYLDHASVDALVQAMSAFAPPADTDTALSPEAAAAVEPVIAANWQQAA